MPGIPGRGERIGSAYVKVYFTGDNSGIKDSLNDPDLEKDAKDAGENQGDAYNEGWTKTLKDRFDAEEKFRKRSEAAYKGWATRRRKAEEEFAKLLDDNADDVDRRNGRISRAFGSIDDTVHKIGRGLLDWRSNLRGFLRFVGLIGRTLTSTGDLMGRMFGKGSRNDFLNIVGALVGGIPKMIGTALTWVGKFGDALGETADVAEKTGQAIADGVGVGIEGVTTGAEEAANASKGLSSSLAAGIPGAIAVGAAMTLLAGSLGIAASAAMLLTGAVIALAASLSFALVGAIGAVAGALVPLAAALGVGILAVTNMDKETKKAFGSVKDEFKDLGKVAAGELFKNAAQDAKTFSNILDSFRPVIRQVARAMRLIGEGWLESMNTFLKSKEGKQFIDLLAQSLPRMLHTIGDIFGNVFGSFPGFFRAVLPLAEDFLGWLAGITGSLKDMGKGGEQSKLSKFFDKAQDSMHAVGDAIGQILGLVGDLFDSPARGQGNKMFQSLADNVRKFRDFLADAKRDGSLKQFFQDARRLAGKIGQAVVEVGKFVGKLDTPENRKILFFMIDAFRKIVHFISVMVGQWNQFTHSITLIIQTIKGPLVKAWNGVRTAASHAASAVQTAWSTAIRWVTSHLESIWHWFRDLPGRIRGVDWGGIGSNIGNDIFNGIIHALTGLPGQIASMFTGLGGQIVNAIGNIDIHIDWPDPPGWLSKLPGFATGGIIAGPTTARLGERGAEAVVPLTGPLSRVDPAVRELSAVARGMGTSSTTTIDRGRRMDVGGITIITPSEDPRAVATQVINRLAAASYIS